MKVKVYAPGFCSFKFIDEDGYMELEENSSVEAVFNKLEIPSDLLTIMVFTVNYNMVAKDELLKDEDVVSFLPMMAGG
ncbi:molybdopterin converting factor small subunit [Anaerosolibacter carboniphilus]|uniref:Molybdopterin converting factor small subunit n=1 Tax=Anaerosolibacter carboniphilus TaxID=1417629 RepID=A0A841KR28_9FIRM|nr:MoaD/ThiS family protein [Anaerosolibacter carboniphilus]MBB6215863.1 molybdopterin converting factor small subunit [Anaerosolibacter carboniphilus]